MEIKATFCLVKQISVALKLSDLWSSLYSSNLGWSQGTAWAVHGLKNGRPRSKQIEGTIKIDFLILLSAFNCGQTQVHIILIRRQDIKGTNLLEITWALKNIEHLFELPWINVEFTCCTRWDLLQKLCPSFTASVWEILSWAKGATGRRNGYAHILSGQVLEREYLSPFHWERVEGWHEIMTVQKWQYQRLVLPEILLVAGSQN